MDVALLLVGVGLTIVLVAQACDRWGVPAPIALLLVGVVGSYLPFVPEVRLTPDLALLGLLPPLLYAAAINASLIDVRAYKIPILGLSVGLVLFTALGVGLVAYALLPIPFALALALGAIVAPPDAVATTAVAKRIGLPRRVTTILEGESLLNDATALVSLRTAVAAAGLVVHGAGQHGPEAVSVASVTLDFVVAVVGGVGMGLAAFVVIGAVRKHLRSSAADTGLSFLAPYLAFLPAEMIHASGVLAVVTAGLLLAYRSTDLQTASSRLSERVNWASVTFLLENAVFLLIGLQLDEIVQDVGQGELTTWRTVLVGLAVLATCLALRPMWMFPMTLVTARLLPEGDDLSHPWRETAVGSWAGMRGVVTLAAALTLPAETPHRASLVLIALVVTIGTLLLQGMTLPAVARALRVHGPDPREDALVEATVLQRVMATGLRELEDDPDSDPAVLDELRQLSDKRINRSWERLGALSGNDAETPSETYRRMRTQMIEAERHELLGMRGEGKVDHEVMSDVMRQLDAEEASLSWGDERDAALRDSVLLPPERIAGACEHLEEEPACATPRTPEGCGECLRAGQTWVHLRMCTHCGEVGCCDSSPGRHASHHHEQTGHPVMRSLEPGEGWRWCFVDEVTG